MCYVRADNSVYYLSAKQEIINYTETETWQHYFLYVCKNQDFQVFYPYCKWNSS